MSNKITFLKTSLVSTVCLLLVGCSGSGQKFSADVSGAASQVQTRQHSGSSTSEDPEPAPKAPEPHEDPKDLDGICKATNLFKSYGAQGAMEKVSVSLAIELDLKNQEVAHLRLIYKDPSDVKDLYFPMLAINKYSRSILAVSADGKYGLEIYSISNQPYFANSDVNAKIMLIEADDLTLDNLSPGGGFQFPVGKKELTVSSNYATCNSTK